MRRIFVIAIAVLVAASFFGSGYFNENPQRIRRVLGTTVVELDPARFPVQRTGESQLHTFSIAELKELEPLAENVRPVDSLSIQVRENGVPLKQSSWHEQISKTPGLFSHWGSHILVSPKEGSIPENAARYTLHYCSHLGLGRLLTNQNVFLWIAAGLGLALALVLPAGERAPKAAIAVVALGLAAVVASHVAEHWNRVGYTPDSQTYVSDFMRPPFYPWFINAARGSSEFTQENRAGDNHFLEQPVEAEYRVVRTQKTIFWLSWLFVSVSLMWAAGRAFALVACLPLLLYRHDWLFAELHHFIMSETIAGAMLLTLFAFAILAGTTRSPWFLPPAALAFACAVLSRVAAGSGVVVLVAAICVVAAAHWRRPRTLAIPLLLVGVVAASSWIWAQEHSRERAGYPALSPLQNFERVAFALEIADDEDSELLTNPNDRRVFVLARANRVAERAKHGWSNKPIEEMELNLNCWASACPAATTVFGELTKSGEIKQLHEKPSDKSQYVFAHETFGRIADTILPMHRDRQFRIFSHFITLAVTENTKLKLSDVPIPLTKRSIKKVSFFGLVVVCLVCCLIGRNLAAVGSLACLAAYALFLAGMCLHEPPLGRYMMSNEWIALFGFALGGLSFVQRAFGWSAAGIEMLLQRWRRPVPARPASEPALPQAA